MTETTKPKRTITIDDIKAFNPHYIPYGYDSKTFAVVNNVLYVKREPEQHYELLKEQFRR